MQDIYALAPLQEGILFHHLMAKQGDPYVLWTLMSFKDQLSLDSYLSALNAVIARHDILRTAVLWEGLSEPVQVVWRRAQIEVEEVQLDPSAGDVAEQLKEHCHPRRCRMDVRRAPMMRLVIAWDAGSRRWLAIWLTHHLVDDVPSSNVLMMEIEAYRAGHGSALSVPLPFRRFVAHARQRNEREHEAFFREMLKEVQEPTAPFGLLEVHGDSAEVTEAHRGLDPTLSSRLRQRARVLGVSAASIFHVAWAQVLARASGQEDPVFGTVVFGRMHGSEGVEQVMGPFINTLPVRIGLSGASVAGSVRETHQLLAQLLLHEYAPLAEVQQCSQVPAGTPLFTALLNYRHIVSVEQLLGVSLEGGEGVEYLFSEGRTNYPLMLSVDDVGDGFELSVQVVPAVGAELVCAMMQVALENLVSALEASPSQPIRELEVLPEQERDQLLVQWNQTAMPYPQDRCIHELVEAQVARAPDAIAVMYEDRTLSYAALNRRANQLAHHLRALGVGADEPVAICLQRGFELIVGVLGILKAGGAYVPLDPEYPAERLAYMLEDSAARVVLTQTSLVNVVSGLPASRRLHAIVLDRDEDRSVIAQQSEQNPVLEEALTARHLAYIIYTSGSTGRPKGISLSHSALVNLIHWHLCTLPPSECTLQLASISFDASFHEIFATWLSGAMLLIPDESVRQEPAALAQVIASYAVDKVILPITLLHHLAEHCRSQPALLASLRTLMATGESLQITPAVRELFSQLPQCTLHNHYGPSETHVVTTHVLSSNPERWPDRPSIGRPIWNTRIYILDKDRRLVPIGVVGELYIGGAGVARGYLKRPELTAERFIESPFVAGDRLYKTGDLARYYRMGRLSSWVATTFR